PTDRLAGRSRMSARSSRDRTEPHMPSTLIDARQITRTHGARTVLDAVDVHLASGDRLAVVGPNGAGKSTLLRILAGLERPDGGTVARHGTVGYPPQTHP